MTLELHFDLQSEVEFDPKQDDTSIAAIAEEINSTTSPVLTHSGNRKRASSLELNTTGSSPPHSQSPPRFCLYRARDGPEAHRRQMDMGDTMTKFRHHMQAQHYANRKNIQMTSIAIIQSSYVIAPLISQEDGPTLWFISNTCPMSSTVDTRTRTIEYVEQHIDCLAEELRLIYQQISGVSDDNDSNTSALRPREMVSSMQMQMLTDVIETVRNLSQMILLSNRRDTSLLSTFKASKSTIERQFFAHLDISRIGAFATIVDPENAVDAICGSNFVVEPPPAISEERAPHSRFVLRCCGNSVCAECVRQHAFTNSDQGCKTFATCMFCRKEWPIYEHMTSSLHQAMAEDSND